MLCSVRGRRPMCLEYLRKEEVEEVKGLDYIKVALYGPGKAGTPLLLPPGRGSSKALE